MSKHCPYAVGISTQRTFGEAPNWLLTIYIDPDHGMEASYPQARAVVDDFGTLVIVRRWL